MAEIAGEQTGTRSHARRNHEALVAAARDVFAEQGVDAPLEAVARRAGVGIGTLYRHFSSREALVEAIFARRIGDLVAVAEAAADEPDDRRRPPGVLVASPGRDDDERCDAATEQCGAEDVDAMPHRRRMEMQPCYDDEDSERADGHVDVEHPAPREVVDEEAAEQRAGHRRHCKDGADQSHVAAALARRDDVGDDRLRSDQQTAGAHPLQRAESDQLSHRLREAGER
jgi:AcrR family transcriptional regulator